MGVLASIFDLASDGLNYEARSVGQFKHLARSILDDAVAESLFTLLGQKEAGTLQWSGLERGVGSLRVVIKHLKADAAWPDETLVVKSGILLQVVDDILDFHHDMASGQLNFLTHVNSQEYIEALLNWEFEEQFQSSQYPAALFRVIRKAQAKARMLSLQKFRPVPITRPAG